MSYHGMRLLATRGDAATSGRFTIGGWGSYIEIRPRGAGWMLRRDEMDRDGGPPHHPLGGLMDGCMARSTLGKTWGTDRVSTQLGEPHMCGAYSTAYRQHGLHEKDPKRAFLNRRPR